jgi:hypothetical protein
MAAEIRISASLSFAKGGSSESMSTPGVLAATMTGSNWIHNRQIVGHAAQEPLLLGEVTSPGGGWCLIYNRNAVNLVSVKPSSSAAALIQIPPFECALFRFHSSVTLPQVQAENASVEIEYLLLQA